MLDELKDELDLDSFFSAMGVRKIRRTSHGFFMRCLHPSHNDTGPSFHYRLSNHKFKCYGCGFRGDVIDIVMVVKNIKFRRAVGWLKEFAGWSATATTIQLQSIMERREKLKNGVDNVSDDVVIIPAYFQTDFSIAGDDVKSYLRKRGWSENLLSDHNIGYCEHGFFRNRIIFPVHGLDDNLTTFAARAVWDVDESVGEMRYLYPLKSQLSKSIWLINNQIEGDPIFVEGAPDALRLREYGYNAYACLGNQLGDIKLELIRSAFKSHKRLIVIPDGDKGGDVLVKWFGRLIHDFDVFIGKFDHGEIKDIDELGLHCGRDAVDDVINNVKSYQDINIENEFNFNDAPMIINDIVKEKKPPVKTQSEFQVIDQLYRPIRL